MATIKDVAKAAGVSTATVSAVVNDSAYVSPELRSRVLVAVSDLRYAPSQVARSLKRGRSQLIALAVADLANPFYSRIVCAAEASVAAWGYSLVVFNSDEKPENEKRILARIRMLGCDGAVLVPVGASDQYRHRDFADSMPMVLLGRSVEDGGIDSVTIDNLSAGRQATNYLLDLGHTRIGSITGPLQLSTGRGRYEGMLEAMAARGVAPHSSDVRSGEFREDTAYSVTRDLLTQPSRPTALYIGNGLMALGVMRAIADLGLRCPEDISIASTDTIAGIGGLRPRLTRAEHPVADMTNEALRMLVDRIEGKSSQPPRNIVFQPTLVVGDSCAPKRETFQQSVLGRVST
jgi:LacI family transcriptional regulator